MKSLVLGMLVAGVIGAVGTCSSSSAEAGPYDWRPNYNVNHSWRSHSGNYRYNNGYSYQAPSYYVQPYVVPYNYGSFYSPQPFYNNVAPFGSPYIGSPYIGSPYIGSPFIGGSYLGGPSYRYQYQYWYGY